MRCELCGQRDVDGAIDNTGSFVCIDCWADGSAQCEGRIAEVATPVQGIIPTYYSSHMHQAFVDRCNRGAK